MSQPEFRLSARAQTLKASAIRELLHLVGRPSMISFAGGIPDPALFNLALFQSACHHAFGGPQVAREALQYSATEGYAPLRRFLADQMHKLGIPARPANILVTTGSQQALDLIGKLLIDPQSTVLTARPTYLGALQAFAAYEARFASLDTPQPVGNAAPRLLYLTPDFANPTGLTMSLAARHAALDTARALNAIIVEDGAYSALRYDGTPLPAIAALDAQSGGVDAGRTLYCGSFSKTLSPGLRVGWVCGPAALIRKLSLLKQSADLHTASVNQMVMHQVALAGLDDQITAIRPVYRARRDAMLAALERYAPPGTHWQKPEGGMFVWLDLPDHIDTTALLDEAIAQDVAFVPGAAFFPDGSGRNSLRLSFSLCDEAQIELGIFKLCGLLDRQARSRAVRLP